MKILRIVSRTRFLIVLTGLIASSTIISAQELKSDPTLPELVQFFVQEIGSPKIEIDRSTFRKHLAGEFSDLSDRSLVGLFPAYPDVYLDSIVLLPTSYVTYPGDPRKKILPRTDSTLHRALYVSYFQSGHFDHLSLFALRDTIWKIEALRQFPDRLTRTSIVDSIRQLANAGVGRSMEAKVLSRILADNRGIESYFHQIETDLRSLISTLSRYSEWNYVDFAAVTAGVDTLDEYRGLDDSLSKFDRIMLMLNPGSMNRLMNEGFEGIYRQANGSILLPSADFGPFSIGYLYAPKELLPPVSSSHYFQILPLGDQWWVYKGKDIRIEPRDQNEF